MYSQIVRRVVKVARWSGRVVGLCTGDLQHSHAQLPRCRAEGHGLSFWGPPRKTLLHDFSPVYTVRTYNPGSSRQPETASQDGMSTK
jgi:hypothetical protein